jgi:polyhydroxyalkanoate synthesis regulator phasin
MAKTQQKDILARFQDIGSEALNKLQDVPGGSKLVDMANETKARLDEMQKKLRGLDELEQRVAALEKQLGMMATKSATKKPSATKPATPKKPPA